MINGNVIRILNPAPDKPNQISEYSRSSLSYFLGIRQERSVLLAAPRTTPTQRTFKLDIAWYWIFIWAQKFKTSTFFFFSPQQICAHFKMNARSERRPVPLLWNKQRLCLASLRTHLETMLVWKTGFFPRLCRLTSTALKSQTHLKLTYYAFFYSS